MPALRNNEIEDIFMFRNLLTVNSLHLFFQLLKQGLTNPGGQVTIATRQSVMAPFGKYIL